MSCFRTCQSDAECIDPLRCQFYQGFGIQQIVKPGITIGNRIGLDLFLGCHLRGAFNDSIQPSTVTPTGDDADFLDLHVYSL